MSRKNHSASFTLRFARTSALAITGLLFTSLAAQAAIFDTIDSVEPLQKIAAENRAGKDQSKNRLPAGKSGEENTDATPSDSSATKE